MDFRIADTFTDSLAKLTGDEQKGRQDHRLRCSAESRPPGYAAP